MTCAMSSGSGSGSAVRAAADGGVVSTSTTGRPKPVEPVGQVAGGDRGDRRGVGEHELDPGRRQRRVDRQIRRPGLQHRQDRHDRLGRTREQQRHALPRARAMADQQVRQPVRRLVELPVGQRRDPRRPAPPRPGVRATCAANSSGTEARGDGLAPRPPGCPTGPGRRARRRRATSIDDSGRPGSAVIATNTRCEPLDQRRDVVPRRTRRCRIRREASVRGPGCACTASG